LRLLAGGARDQVAGDLAKLRDGEGKEVGEPQEEAREAVKLRVLNGLGLGVIELGVAQLAMAVAADGGERLAMRPAFDVVKLKAARIALAAEATGRIVRPEGAQSPPDAAGLVVSIRRHFSAPFHLEMIS
jgi:hypothetical protein